MRVFIFSTQQIVDSCAEAIQIVENSKTIYDDSLKSETDDMICRLRNMIAVNSLYRGFKKITLDTRSEESMNDVINAGHFQHKKFIKTLYLVKYGKMETLTLEAASKLAKTPI